MRKREIFWYLFLSLVLETENFRFTFLTMTTKLVKLNVNSPNSDKRIGSKRKTARNLRARWNSHKEFLVVTHQCCRKFEALFASSKRYVTENRGVSRHHSSSLKQTSRLFPIFPKTRSRTYPGNLPGKPTLTPVAILVSGVSSPPSLGMSIQST